MLIFIASSLEILKIPETISCLLNLKLNKNNYFNWKNKRILEKIARFPRMVQMWKMFSPNVPTSDKIIIVEAFLDNGETIDPFTGKTPIFYSTDYSLLMNNKSQLWRKYFENFRNIDGTNPRRELTI